MLCFDKGGQRLKLFCSYLSLALVSEYFDKEGRNSG